MLSFFGKIKPFFNFFFNPFCPNFLKAQKKAQIRPNLNKKQNNLINQFYKFTRSNKPTCVKKLVFLAKKSLEGKKKGPPYKRF